VGKFRDRKFSSPEILRALDDFAARAGRRGGRWVRDASMRRARIRWRTVMLTATSPQVDLIDLQGPARE